MEKVRYMISDAASLVAVESHVLRYWEDELGLHIPRNELGHRYYTQDNIQDFLRIKELKEQGYQLKAIRLILQDNKERKEESAAEPAIRIEKVNGLAIRDLGKHGRRKIKKQRLSRKERKMLKNKNEMAPDLTI